MPDQLSWIDKIKYGRYILDNIGTLRPLLDAPAKLADARKVPGIAQEWDVVKWAGDIVVPVIDNFPKDEDDVSTLAEADVQAAAVSLGISWEQLMEVAAFVAMVVKMIRGSGLI